MWFCLLDDVTCLVVVALVSYTLQGILSDILGVVPIQVLQKVLDLYIFRVCARIYFSFATIFANQIFFCAIFLNLEPDFWPFFVKKEPGFGSFFA